MTLEETRVLIEKATDRAEVLRVDATPWMTDEADLLESLADALSALSSHPDEETAVGVGIATTVKGRVTGIELFNDHAEAKSDIARRDEREARLTEAGWARGVYGYSIVKLVPVPADGAVT